MMMMAVVMMMENGKGGLSCRDGLDLGFWGFWISRGLGLVTSPDGFLALHNSPVLYLLYLLYRTVPPVLAFVRMVGRYRKYHGLRASGEWSSMPDPRSDGAGWMMRGDLSSQPGRNER